MCVNLYCEKPDGYCSSNDEPAADGTSCGHKKVQTHPLRPTLLSPHSYIRFISPQIFLIGDFLRSSPINQDGVIYQITFQNGG